MQTENKQRASLRSRYLTLLLVTLPGLVFSASASDFEKLDLNQDQRLSAGEFVNAKFTIADFKAADSNQNQSVSAVEFASFLTSLRKPKERPNSGPHPPHG